MRLIFPPLRRKKPIVRYMPKTAPKCSEGNNGPQSKFKNYCFTSFEPRTKKPPMADCFRFLCYSPEICPTTGRHHWQGYVYLKDQKTKNALHKYMLKHHKYHIGNLTICDGTAEQNMTYCGKADYTCPKTGKFKQANPEYEEFGKPPQQGERIDLIKIGEEIKNGKPVDDIAIENPYIYHQYGRTLNKLESIALKKKFRNWMTVGLWYYGPTGVGKSHAAFENFNPSTHYVLNQNDGGFWQGYTGQETIIINEFRGEIKFSTLLEIVDKWPYNVKIKGNDTYPLLAKKVIITSCKHPKEVYINCLDDNERIDQLTRRFEIIELKKKCALDD